MKSVRHLFLLTALATSLASAASAAVETYVIDPVHSSIAFKIRHFVSKTPGAFTKFSGTIAVDREQLENSSVEATIEIGSINTADEKRDAHLKASDFFDALKFPTATFKSKAWKKTGDDTYAVTGDLTLKGVTKEVVLSVKLLGFGPGMKGAVLSGWEATTTLNKADFGVNGPAMLGKALGDEVAITINIEAGKKS
ncbi:MAG: polyisoprenoid-binding protein [Opitutae bacterium]|nr:polyisoprenoid-binding protein [Opitutae bacterium]